MAMAKLMATTVGLVGLLTMAAAAQVILVPGGEGTLGLDGTIDKVYKGTHRALVKTADGVRHLVHLNGDSVVHGTDDPAADPLTGLTVGTHVAVHYVVKGDRKEVIELDRVGDEGLSVVDGTVIEINRAARTMAIAEDDGRRVTLRLTDRAARDVGKDIGSEAQVIVFYSDEGGDDGLVAHYFKKAR